MENQANTVVLSVYRKIRIGDCTKKLEAKARPVWLRGGLKWMESYFGWAVPARAGRGGSGAAAGKVPVVLGLATRRGVKVLCLADHRHTGRKKNLLCPIIGLEKKNKKIKAWEPAGFNRTAILPTKVCWIVSEFHQHANQPWKHFGQREKLKKKKKKKKKKEKKTHQTVIEKNFWKTQANPPKRWLSPAF